ncbi:Hypothetical predicted protein [Paramuricea clavata]|uniref:Uncharacterized protein n=1 Tax=Paramuricea clavata TaxID=317549 RepID=A0A6S7GXS5_PARCT|nr:Hypothetical predicted protein [Paramuricea clavata]
MSVNAEAYGDGEMFYQIKQGIRSQREAFKSLRVKTSLDCVLFCFREETCNSFNYAAPTSVSDGEENCELHIETKNDDGNSLEFLKDDRYTFYHIPGISDEQAVTPSLNKSCLDHFNHGSKTSGEYTILDWQQKPRTVYCDMESEPGSVWTLIMSFTIANNALAPHKAMYENAPANEYTPNWSNYRMSLNQLTDLRNKTSHWRATCSFQEYGDDIHTDYVRAVFTDFDLMGEFWGACKKASYISVMGRNCSECTSLWSQGKGYSPHTDVACDLQTKATQQQIIGLDRMCDM